MHYTYFPFHICTFAPYLPPFLCIWCLCGLTPVHRQWHNLSIPLMPWGQSSHSDKMSTFFPISCLPSFEEHSLWFWLTFIFSKVQTLINSLCLLAYEPGNGEFTKYKCSEHLWCCHSLNKCLAHRWKGCYHICCKRPCVPCTQFPVLWETMFLRTRKNETLPSDWIMLHWMLSITHITTCLQLLLEREFANSKLSLQISITRYF